MASQAVISAPIGGVKEQSDAVRKDIRRERSRLMVLLFPGLAIMAILLLAPLAWLAGLSFLDGDGNLSLANYNAILHDASYAKSLWLTIWMSAVTTVVCALTGYILAYAMAHMPPMLAAISLMLVALPFWTSVLVRTYAWLILLQNKGIVNNALISMGIIEAPLHMMHNTFGALVGMIHIMLPFMIFPLYANLRSIDPVYVMAAVGLGATPSYAFRKVYFPQSLPGIVAGCVLVFILSLGFYITPSLLGGGRTIVMAVALERDVSMYFNWGPASAVTVLFVGAVLGLFALVGRYMSLDRLFQK